MNVVLSYITQVKHSNYKVILYACKFVQSQPTGV